MLLYHVQELDHNTIMQKLYVCSRTELITQVIANEAFPVASRREAK
jgi:hypothetical protein